MCRSFLGVEARSSNRLWAYGGENFYAPSASKICLPRISTTTCKGNIHGLTYKTNIYTKFKIIYKIFFEIIKGPRGYPKDITPERMFRKIKKTIFERGSK